MSRAAQLVLRGALKAVRLVAPLLRVRLSERGSYLLSPLVQTAQAMSISTAPLQLTPAVIVPTTNSAAAPAATRLLCLLSFSSASGAAAAAAASSGPSGGGPSLRP